jgi:hypothetical protein
MEITTFDVFNGGLELHAHDTSMQTQHAAARQLDGRHANKQFSTGSTEQ